MKFRLSTILILVFVLSVALSLYVFETTKTVESDISYEVPVKIVPHPSIAGKGSYALVAKKDLSDAMRVWQTPDKDGVFQVQSANPDGAPPMIPLDIQAKSISVPRSEMRSPLLNRKISIEQPFDCMVVYTEHRYGCSYRMIMGRNLNTDQSIEIDLNSSIERSKQQDQVK